LELRIFAYGTLKRGFPNHAEYCSGALRISPACLRGRLFKLSPEIPVMIVPGEDIAAYGTSSFAADIEVQEQFEAFLKGKKAKGWTEAGGAAWRKVGGELLVFDDPYTRLPLLDSLEEFQPGHSSTYIRVLVPITVSSGLETCAWTYIAGFDPTYLQEYEGENWSE
jgi:gamma-glutamylcyclotransferase (GGCT)/AIG2-like uncharacterized protein YtfP